MVPQRIEREVLIDAPAEVVWAVVTEPEHISGWFSDTAEIDLVPGGRLVLRWSGYGRVHGRVERVEPPHLFSFRWAVDPDGPAEVSEDNSTLVEFRLSAEGHATRLTVVESGFRDLARSEDERQGHADSHRSGWERELGELADYATRQTGAPADR